MLLLIIMPVGIFKHMPPPTDAPPKALHGADPDPWHFARADLARRVFGALRDRFANAIVLFAPRRTGKTQFLTHDLGPLAEAAGHTVVYANFWALRSDPVGVLIRSLEEAERHKTGLVARARRAALDAVASVELAVALPPITVKVGGRRGATRSVHPLVYIDRLLRELSDTQKPSFLLLDEAQTLAGAGGDAARNREILAALRTSFDSAIGGLAPVFTGSSDHALRKMLKNRDAAFFDFAVDTPFEPLDAAFVDHIRKKFHDRTAEAVPRPDALKVFERFDRNPKIFRDLFIDMLLEAGLTITVAADRRAARIERDDRLQRRWEAMPALDQAVFDFLLDGGRKPYTKANRARIAADAGQDDVSASKVQTALVRLAREDILERDEAGDVAILDSDLRVWREHDRRASDADGAG